MLVRDVLSQSIRSKEDEHFRTKDEQWIKKMQRQTELEIECRQMGMAIGVTHQEILQDLQKLGYSRDTVKLLYIVPQLQVAWSKGHVTQQERKRILEVAEWHGIERGSLAYSQLSEWLSFQPGHEFFKRTLSVIRGLLRVMPAKQRQAIKADLVSRCTHIAATSGGLLGFGQTISDTEQALLKHIAGELEDPQDASA